MVEGEQSTALIDCGPSSLISMKQRGVSPNQVDVILLTHLHGDHFGGIPFFLLDAAFASRRSTPLVVAGPPGARERIRAAQEVLFPTSSTLPWRYGLDILELEPGQTHRIRDLDVTPLLMDHPSGAPSTSSWPSVTSNNLGTRSTRVVFPAPVDPMMAQVVPRSTRNETLRSTGCSAPG